MKGLLSMVTGSSSSVTHEQNNVEPLKNGKY